MQKINEMILAANQPYFIPYIGYWQLINCADVFVILDDYAYINRGWIKRNHVISNGLPIYLGIFLKKASQNKKINDTFLAEQDFNKLLKSIYFFYHKAPSFQQGYQLMESIFSCTEQNLAKFLHHSMQVIANYLEIKTKFVLSSEMDGNNQFRREQRIYDQCIRLGANTYINAIGGINLYDFEEFRKRGITLKFLKSIPVEYKQFNHPFVPNLSILDVIMFNSREEVIKMLNSYVLI